MFIRNYSKSTSFFPQWVSRFPITIIPNLDIRNSLFTFFATNNVYTFIYKSTTKFGSWSLQARDFFPREIGNIKLHNITTFFIKASNNINLFGLSQKASHIGKERIEKRLFLLYN